MIKTGKTQVHLFSGWKGHEREPPIGDVYTIRGNVSIHFDHAEKLYPDWPTPTCIISDGPYGVSGFPGDNHKPESLAEWYESHIKAWSQYATPETTLWFWSTEVGWAAVHPVLISNGWSIAAATSGTKDSAMSRAMRTPRPCASSLW